MAWPFHLYKFKSPLCQIWLKLTQWFWRRICKCEKFTNRRREDRRSEKLRWAKNGLYTKIHVLSPKKLNFSRHNRNIRKTVDVRWKNILSVDHHLIIWTAIEKKVIFGVCACSGRRAFPVWSWWSYSSAPGERISRCGHCSLP